VLDRFGRTGREEVTPPAPVYSNHALRGKFLSRKHLGLEAASRLHRLNAVISSFRFQSRRLARIAFVHPTRSERIHFGFASTVLECDDGSLAVSSEVHAAVFHSLGACPKG